MHKDLLDFLLKNIETSPEAAFYESELRPYADFDMLRKKKYLKWVQYNPENEPYYSSRLGDNGNERFVRRVNGKIYAYSTEDSAIGRLELKEEDVNRWSFAIDKLVAEIKDKNGLTKNLDRITPRVYFIGEKTVLQDGIGVFVAFMGDDEQAEAELLGLRAKIGKADKILVLCPIYVITSQDLLGRLAGQNITCLTFKEVFNGKGYTIDFSKVRFGEVAGQATPKLTAVQMADYSKHKYLCYDSLHIPGTGQLKRSNDVVVNGHTIKMPDGPFRLLVELVAELKKGKGGWLTKHTEAGKYQSIDRLRKPIEGSLLKKDAKKLIENNASKQYRISTHPDFVTYDRKVLLEHENLEIQALAKGLPKNSKEKRL